MRTRISISACRHAIAITQRGYEPGIPLEIDGEQRMIAKIENLHGRWYSGDYRLTRRQQEQLTQRALAIIEKDRGPQVPPRVSIRDCQKAIEIAGGIRISLRGEEQLITDLRTGGGGNTRWFSGDLRFTVTEQRRLTRLAREIIKENRGAGDRRAAPKYKEEESGRAKN